MPCTKNISITPYTTYLVISNYQSSKLARADETTHFIVRWQQTNNKAKWIQMSVDKH